MAEGRIENLENTVKELKTEIEKLKQKVKSHEDDIYHLRGNINTIASGETPEYYE
jgi:predicted RNase H-like nuclease (RuvC/YqgF family)